MRSRERRHETFVTPLGIVPIGNLSQVVNAQGKCRVIVRQERRRINEEERLRQFFDRNAADFECAVEVLTRVLGLMYSSPKQVPEQFRVVFRLWHKIVLSEEGRK